MEDIYLGIIENRYFRFNNTTKRVVRMIYTSRKSTLNNEVKEICEKILNGDTKDFFLGISNNKLNLCTISQLYEMDCDCVVINMPKMVTHQIAAILEILEYK